jgi:hypothetical protein
MYRIGTLHRFLRVLTISCILSVVLVFSPGVRSEKKAQTVEDFKQLLAQNPIRFEDYKTTNVWNGKRHPPILNTRSKRLFRTVLREAAKGGPDFDGKYVVASWHCGTECQQFAIIDLETGIVTDGFTSNYEQVYRLDSNLLIVNDPDRMLKYTEDQEMIPSWWYTSYYRWDGESLVLIKSINR